MATQTYLNAAGVALLASAAGAKGFVASRVGQVLTGTAGNDALRTIAGGATLAGGAGDDTYYVYGVTDQVIELAGAGVDTIVSAAPFYALPANVENLTVVSAGGTGWGNAQDNILIASGGGGGGGTHVLNGGAGNDVLVSASAAGGTSSAAPGPTVFAVARGEGSDVVVGFVPGTDRIELDGFAGLADYTSLAAIRVAGALRQVGADAVLDLGGGAGGTAGVGQTLTLRGVAASALGEQDFLLPLSTAGMRLTFDDEFSGPLSSSPLPTGKTTDGRNATWRTRYDSGRTLPSNHEAEYYADSTVGPTNPFSIGGDGVLTITASPAALSGANELGLAYNSGVLTTSKSFAQQYGYYEVRAQLPTGQGFWPAFWLMPTDGTWPPEVDIMEMLGNDPTTIYATAHTAANGGKHEASQTVLHTADTSQAFHTYGLLWDAQTIRWYFDGNEYASVATPADLNKPMYLLVNLAVGGVGSWPGAADGTTVGQMKLDYVRAYATSSTVNVTGSAAIAPASTAAAAAAVAAAPATIAVTPHASSSSSSSGASSVTAIVATASTAATQASSSSSNGGVTTATQQSQPQQPTIVTLDGKGGSVLRGDGLFSVTGAGSGGRVALGKGNQTVTLTGSQNTVQLGEGNHAVTLSGSSNTIVAGAGASKIDAGSGNAKVSVGASTSGTTVIKAAGANDVITATGNGNVQVSGTEGSARVSLLDGDHWVMLGGSGNVVTTTGRGSSSISAGSGRAVVRTGAGNDTIRVAGWDNLIDGGGGANALIGGSGRDTFVLNAAGQGMDRISGFKLTNGDVLDLSRTLAGAALAKDLSNLGSFLSARTGSDGTTLLVDTTGGRGGGAAAFALLQDVTASVSDLAAHHSIQVNGRVT